MNPIEQLIEEVGDEECVLCEEVSEGVIQVLYRGHITGCVEEYRKISSRDNQFYINTVDEFAEAANSRIKVH